MSRKNVISFLFIMGVLSSMLTVWPEDRRGYQQSQRIADEKSREEDRILLKELEQRYFYGWQIMTQAERAQHIKMIVSFTTTQQREAYLHDHINKMLARARERGVTLAVSQN